jgi:hypothetical protein
MHRTPITRITGSRDLFSGTIFFEPLVEQRAMLPACPHSTSDETHITIAQCTQMHMLPSVHMLQLAEFWLDYEHPCTCTPLHLHTPAPAHPCTCTPLHLHTPAPKDALV